MFLKLPLLWSPFVAGRFSEDIMASRSSLFRIGRVQAFLCALTWYLCYHENDKRHRPRIGPDREAAKQLAAQINAQLEVGPGRIEIRS